MRQKPVRERQRAKQLVDQDIKAHRPLQQQSQVEHPLIEHPRQIWPIELWQENRGIFKELIKHIMFFLLFLGSLIGIHEILARSGLPANQIEIIDKIHFYESIIALLIFSGSFVIKVLIFEFQRTRD